MKESIGGTAALNIALTFIAIVFAFLAATLSYYKAYKVNNIIINSLEKFEGHNSLAFAEINNKLDSIGYQRFSNANCKSILKFGDYDYQPVSHDNDGFCVYMRYNNKKKTYQYVAVSYMTINLPILSDIVRIPVKAVTKELYGCYGSNSSFTAYDGNVSCD